MMAPTNIIIAQRNSCDFLLKCNTKSIIYLFIPLPAPLKHFNGIKKISKSKENNAR